MYLPLARAAEYRRVKTVRLESAHGHGELRWEGDEEGGRIVSLTGPEPLVKAVRERLTPESMPWYDPEVGGFLGFDPARWRHVEMGLRSLTYGAEPALTRVEHAVNKAGGPYIGPKGGKWADPQHTIPWPRTLRDVKPEHPSGMNIVSNRTGKHRPHTHVLGGHEEVHFVVQHVGNSVPYSGIRFPDRESAIVWASGHPDRQVVASSRTTDGALSNRARFAVGESLREIKPSRPRSPKMVGRGDQGWDEAVMATAERMADYAMRERRDKGEARFAELHSKLVGHGPGGLHAAVLAVLAARGVMAPRSVEKAVSSLMRKGLGSAIANLFRTKPPQGFTPIPGSKHGGYHKQVGGQWVTWYPRRGHGPHPRESFTPNEHAAEHAEHARREREADESRRALEEDEKQWTPWREGPDNPAWVPPDKRPKHRPPSHDDEVRAKRRRRTEKRRVERRMLEHAWAFAKAGLPISADLGHALASVGSTLASSVAWDGPGPELRTEDTTGAAREMLALAHDVFGNPAYHRDVAWSDEEIARAYDLAHELVRTADALMVLAKSGGPFIGPRGGKWADAKHTIPWKPDVPKKSHEAPAPKSRVQFPILHDQEPEFGEGEGTGAPPATLDEAVEARAKHGTPIIVAYGMGVDSTAMLVGMQQRGIRPDKILFADTGSEKPETYAYRAFIDAWLARHDFPPVTVVKLGATTNERGTYDTLEGNCLVNNTLPSLAFGGRGCSTKWKHAPQHAHLKRDPQTVLAWGKGQKVFKLIGYDAGPVDARRPQIGDDEHYRYAYPLRDWGWDREECKRQIAGSGLPVPPKSACFFCPSSKPDEIREMGQDLLRRIVRMEAGAEPRQLERLEQGKKAIEGLWRAPVAGHRGATPKPGSMTEFIAGEGLLPELAGAAQPWWRQDAVVSQRDLFGEAQAGPKKVPKRRFPVIEAAAMLKSHGGGPYIGPKGGKWADPQHKIPWDPARHTGALWSQLPAHHPLTPEQEARKRGDLSAASHISAVLKERIKQPGVRRMLGDELYYHVAYAEPPGPSIMARPDKAAAALKAVAERIRDNEAYRTSNWTDMVSHLDASARELREMVPPRERRRNLANNEVKIPQWSSVILDGLADAPDSPLDDADWHIARDAVRAMGASDVLRIESREQGEALVRVIEDQADSFESQSSQKSHPEMDDIYALAEMIRARLAVMKGLGRALRQIAKAGVGPYVGPHGGQWADPQHTKHWEQPRVHGAVAYLSHTRHPVADPEWERARALVVAAKEGQHEAVQQIAHKLASQPALKNFRGLVVPVPRSRPERPSHMGLARALVGFGVGDHAAELLARTSPVESSRARRQRGSLGVSPSEHADTMQASLGARDLDTPIVLVDDVHTSGSSMMGAVAALRRAGHRATIIGAAGGYTVDSPGDVVDPMAPAILDRPYVAKGRGGPYIGPRGGKWADPQHKIPWRDDQLDLFGAKPKPGQQASQQQPNKPSKHDVIEAILATRGQASVETVSGTMEALGYGQVTRRDMLDMGFRASELGEWQPKKPLDDREKDRRLTMLSDAAMKGREHYARSAPGMFMQFATDAAPAPQPAAQHPKPAWAQPQPTTTEILHRFPMDEGTEMQVAKVTGGYTAFLHDAEAGKTFPEGKRFPTLEEAVAYARGVANPTMKAVPPEGFQPLPGSTTGAHFKPDGASKWRLWWAEPWRPKEGDDVIQMAPGVGGGMALIHGKLERRRNGALGVRVGKTSGGVGPSGGKLVDLRPEWESAKRFWDVREARQRMDEAEAKASRSEFEQELADIGRRDQEAAADVAARVKRGDVKPVAREHVKPGATLRFHPETGLENTEYPIASVEQHPEWGHFDGGPMLRLVTPDGRTYDLEDDSDARSLSMAWIEPAPEARVEANPSSETISLADAVTGHRTRRGPLHDIARDAAAQGLGVHHHMNGWSIMDRPRAPDGSPRHWARIDLNDATNALTWHPAQDYAPEDAAAAREANARLWPVWQRLKASAQT